MVERNHTWIFFCESLKVVWSSTWPLSKAIIPISNVLVFFSGKSIQSLTVSQSLSLSHFQDYWVLEFQAMYFICNYCTFFMVKSLKQVKTKVLENISKRSHLCATIFLTRSKQTTIVLKKKSGCVLSELVVWYHELA